MSKESDIRQAAGKLDEAIAAGKAAGLKVTWPGHPKPIAASVGISETASSLPQQRKTAVGGLAGEGVPAAKPKAANSRK